MTIRSATMTLQEAVEHALDGRESQVLCPAHEDRQPSLHVSPGRTQPVILKCFGGCDPEDIIGAGALDWAQVSNPLAGVDDDVDEFWTPAGKASHVYPYYDAEGTLLYKVLRVPEAGGGKRFLQCRPDDSKPYGRSWKLGDVQRVIYRLPDVLAAVAAGHTIHVTEGEKCADALAPVIPEGDVATCNSGGAGKWLPEFGEWLAGASVVVYADADDAGRAHSRLVREILTANDCTVRVVEAPPGIMKNGKAITDVADHLEAGKDLDSLLETTPEQEQARAQTGVDVLDLVQRPAGKVEFVIPNVLAKGERLIVIGFEGNGKSTLLRQLAVQTAAGIHPFTGREMEPRKVLYIDAENHPDQVQDSWGSMVGLAARLERPVERGMLTVMEEFESERDLTALSGVSWLEERVHAYKPELIIMGPLTNMASRDLRDDEPVRKIRDAVNAARRICNSAFIMEHHAPHKSGMDRERALRPYGSSMLLKWPDYGYGIKPTEDPKVFGWAKFRGARVRNRLWPDALREGNIASLEFPWVTTSLEEHGLS